MMLDTRCILGRHAFLFVVMSSFDSLGIAPWLIRALASISIARPTEIQRACIPPTLNGCSPVIGSARTGSGKTAAFALPILHQWSQDPYGVYAVIITPTRELAFQIADQFKILVAHGGFTLRMSLCVGGMDMIHQALELSRKPDIIVATPGRLADHLRSSSDITLDRARYVVLDEADRLLTDGFAEDVGLVMERCCRKEKQVLLYTATLTDAVVALRDQGGDKGYFHQCESEYLSLVASLKQCYVLAPSHVKDAHMVAVLQHQLETHAKLTIMLFVAKCKTAEVLRVMLQDLGVDCVALHSKLTQGQRLGAIDRFKSSKTRVLIATDVASRGLDIPTVGLVLNYDLPRDPADYVHRVGRTARAGRGGLAVSLVTERDVALVQAIEASVGRKMEAYEDVGEKEVLEILSKVSTSRRVAILHLHDTQFGAKDEERRRKRGETSATSTSTAHPHPPRSSHSIKKHKASSK